MRRSARLAHASYAAIVAVLRVLVSPSLQRGRGTPGLLVAWPFVASPALQKAEFLKLFVDAPKRSRTPLPR